MNQMKQLQPKMNEIRERTKDDKLKMNQEVMELYKREKVNPASGCLPMFIQIPVFFSLYKVLYVSIEMRHAPFFGWIHDLSAPDPTNLFTLFGLIGSGTPAHRSCTLGVWPILMCVTMVIQQRQSPPPPDPTQAKMMKALPVRSSCSCSPTSPPGWSSTGPGATRFPSCSSGTSGARHER